MTYEDEAIIRGALCELACCYRFRVRRTRVFFFMRERWLMRGPL